MSRDWISMNYAVLFLMMMM